MLNKEEVLQIARLARLTLGRDEIPLFTHQLGTIVDHFENLKEADTFNVKPDFYFSTRGELLREDNPASSLSQQKALENAPREEDGFFRVPPTFEREE